MAKRRMFSLNIVDSDAFLTMPSTSQNLYFHFGMRADDDGVVDNPRIIARMIGASEDDIKILIAKKFVLPLGDSGLLVVKHWKINNYIQKDRYDPSKYQEELAKLELDENGSYRLIESNVYKMDTQDRIGKVRIGKDSIEIKTDKTQIKGESLAEQLYEKLVFANYEQENSINKDDYLNYLNELLAKYKLTDIKVKIDYFTSTVNVNEVKNKFLYFVVSLTRSFNQVKEGKDY